MDENGIEQTGIKNVVMSGGVSQNIKANKLICELEELEDLHIPPGPGDRHFNRGCILRVFQAGSSPHSIQPLKNAYFCFSQTTENETRAALTYAEEQEFDVIKASADDIGNC